MPMQGALPSNFRAFRCRHLPGTRHRHGSRKMGQWLQDFSSTFLLREEQHCSIGRAWRRLWTARSCDLELRSAARTSLAALELVARAWHHMASKRQFSQRGNDIRSYITLDELASEYGSSSKLHEATYEQSMCGKLSPWCLPRDTLRCFFPAFCRGQENLASRNKCPLYGG